MKKYPQHIKDELGRVYITKVSNSKTIIKKYWGKTNKIKMFYTLKGDIDNPKEIGIDVIDKDGNIIITYSNFLGLNIKLSGFKGFNSGDVGGIKFLVKEEKVRQWIVDSKINK